MGDGEMGVSYTRPQIGLLELSDLVMMGTPATLTCGDGDSSCIVTCDRDSSYTVTCLRMRTLSLRRNPSHGCCTLSYLTASGSLYKPSQMQGMQSNSEYSKFPGPRPQPL